MNFSNINFGYDEYNPVDYYRVQPEDINPSLKSGYVQKVADYYSEPPVSRFKSKSRSQKKCNCGNHGKATDGGLMGGNMLNVLVIILIVITVIQWIIIFWSSNSSVVINNINNTPPENVTSGGEADLLNNVI